MCQIFTSSFHFEDFYCWHVGRFCSTFLSLTVSDPSATLFAPLERQLFSLLTQALCVLQVLKPVSEHYMEDNVRQTVVNSIKASLTEQAAQHTKLKTQ